MENRQANNLIEDSVALALKSEPENWTPECLAPEQVIALVERALPDGQASPLMAHVALCARCRREYAETVELFQLAEEVRSLEAQAEQTPVADVAPLNTGFVPAEPPAQEKDTSVPVARQPKQPAFWERWFAPARRGPALGFAFGAMAASGLLFVVWNAPRKIKVTPAVPDGRLASLRGERDAQTARANQAEQERQRLEREVALLQQNMTEASRLAGKVADLNGQVKTQSLRIARLNDAATVLRELPLPAADWLARENTQTRGSGGTDTPLPIIALLHPVNSAVDGTRPVLECRPVTGVTGHKITLESDSTSVEIPAPQPLSPTRWQPSVPLAPGTVYKWEVTAQRGSETIRSRTAKFYVLSAAEKRSLADARRKYAHSPLVLGAVYARLGLWEEAAQRFRAVPKADASQAVAQRWLHEIEIETQRPK